jgi:hypothetical protein
LVDRLREAITTRRDLAEALDGRAWKRATVPGDWVNYAVVCGADRGDLVADAEVILHCGEDFGDHCEGPAMAAHIVANDPATVLRRCNVDLRVLDRYEEQLRRRDKCTAWHLEPGYSAEVAATLEEVVGDLAEAYGVDLETTE